MSQLKIIDVNAHNVKKTGFFCYMSKRKTEGFQRKLAWFKARFAEGMQLKLLELPERGFIDYIPGEFAWRAVNASGCAWKYWKRRVRG